jgi:5'-nucleotidase (lipoprotein e(P4) family)
MTRRFVALFALLLVCSTTTAAQQPATSALGIKYVRDSEEYAVLARQVYRQAGEAVRRLAAEGGSRPWTVILDIDETALDNSTYQLERAAYSLPYDSASWRAWVERREAPAVPGVVGFIELVRKSGGHVAWITNRDSVLMDATRANLRTLGMWSDDDRLCGQKNPQHTKAQRRHEVMSGDGDCAWPSSPSRVLALVGDQMGDFPAIAEQIPQTGTDDAFGRTCFLLPNSMYGGWTTAVTRTNAAR